MKWQCSIEDFKEPSDRDMKVYRRYLSECERLGIPIGIFGDTYPYTQDELEAIAHLMNSRKIPANLEKRLLDTKIQRMSSRPQPDERFARTNTEKELEEFLNS